MYRLVVVLLSINLFFSCSSDEDILVFKEVIGHVEIETPFDTNSRTVRSHLVYLNSKSYLARENLYKKSIQIFDLENGELEKEIVLSQDGPNRVTIPYGFTFHNMDSIFVSAVPPEIVLINSNGEVNHRRKVNSPGLPITSIHAFNSTPFQIVGNKLYGAQPNFLGHHEISAKDFKDHYHIFKYDMKQDSIHWFPVQFREDHWKNGKKKGGLSFAIAGDSIIVSPNHDHDLWIYDLKTGEHINNVEAKSNHVNEFLYLNELPSGNEEGNKLNLSYPQYENLIFDPYRELFYRFYYLPYEFSEGEFLADLRADRPLIGVMILNQKLEVLGEHHFEKFEIEAGNYFVGEKGLYLSSNNLNHPAFSDDYIKYQIVNFSFE